MDSRCETQFSFTRLPLSLLAEAKTGSFQRLLYRALGEAPALIWSITQVGTSGPWVAGFHPHTMKTFIRKGITLMSALRTTVSRECSFRDQKKSHVRDTCSNYFWTLQTQTLYHLGLWKLSKAKKSGLKSHGRKDAHASPQRAYGNVFLLEGVQKSLTGYRI